MTASVMISLLMPVDVVLLPIVTLFMEVMCYSIYCCIVALCDGGILMYWLCSIDDDDEWYWQYRASNKVCVEVIVYYWYCITVLL